MLKEADVIARRTSYACCAMTALVEAVEAEAVGNTQCAKEKMDLAVYMYTAKRYMDQTAVGDECCGCLSLEEASVIAAVADCHCKTCAQGGEPGTDPCVITPNYTVIRTIDVSERDAIEGASPQNGDSYLVVTDTGAATGLAVNTIITWQDGAWVTQVLQNGQVVLDQSGPTFWTTLGFDTPGPLHPPITLELFEAFDVYVMQSTAPQIALFSNRTATVRVYVNNVWQTVFQGPESDLAVPSTITFEGTPVTAVMVVYDDGFCKYQSSATVIPPFGECGTVVSSAEAIANCGTDTFLVNVSIVSVSGYPLGNITHTVNGVAQPDIPAVLGVTELGPFATGAVVTIGITNTQNSECNVDLGSFVDPSVPVVADVIRGAEDAAFESSALPFRTYLIVSDTTGAGNTWADNVGFLFNGATFEAPAPGAIYRIQGTTGYEGLWQVYSSGPPKHLYPGVTLEFTSGFPNAWQLVSNTPLSADGRMRIATVEALFGSDWVGVWAGLEDLLATAVPVALDASPVPDAVRVTYYGGPCPVTVPGTVVSGVVNNQFSCGPISYYSYVHNPGNQPNWTFTTDTPGGTITLTFAQGSIDSVNDVVRIYDGTDNLGTLLFASSVDALAGVTATSSGPSLYMEVDFADDSGGQEELWLWQVSCTPLSPYPDASVVVSDDCDEYTFTIAVELLFSGGVSGLADIQYRVNGGSLVTVADVPEFDVAVLGPFPIGATVEVFVVNQEDAAASRYLGVISSAGTCPVENNPCAPSAGLKIDYDGDITEIPEVPGDGTQARLYLVRTDTTLLGTWPIGAIIQWNTLLQEWELLTILPPGGLVYGPTSDDYYTFGSGVVFSYFTPILLQVLPVPVDGSYYRATIADVRNDLITTDRPLALQIYSAGVWVTVWTGTEQDFQAAIFLTIAQPFSAYRTVFNPGTCAYVTTQISNVNVALEVQE